MIGYICGYLRYYYPCEFITAYLNNANNDDDINMGTQLARTLGISISGIKFGMSQELYSCDHNNKIIYKGLSSIKFMNKIVSRELYDLRENKYDSFISLLSDINNLTSCDSRQLDILIKLNFFSDFGHPNQLLKQVEIFNNFFNKKLIKKDKIAEYPQWIFDKYCLKETEKQYKFEDTVPMIKELCKVIEYDKTSVTDILAYEFDNLGYLQYTKPGVSEDYYYVCNIDGNWITLYRIKDGETIKIKSRKKYINGLEIKKVIKVLDISQEKKWRKNGVGDWERIDEYEDILKEFKILV